MLQYQVCTGGPNSRCRYEGIGLASEAGGTVTPTADFTSGLNGVLKHILTFIKEFTGFNGFVAQT